MTVSPAEIGAGPITLLVANQSGASQTLTIDGPRLRRSVGPDQPAGHRARSRLTSAARRRTRIAAEESAGLRAGDARRSGPSARARRTSCCCPSRLAGAASWPLPATSTPVPVVHVTDFT